MIGHKRQTQTPLYPSARALSRMVKMKLGDASGGRILQKNLMMKVKWSTKPPSRDSQSPPSLKRKRQEDQMQPA
jgi:hypothetical protein